MAPSYSDEDDELGTEDEEEEEEEVPVVRKRQKKWKVRSCFICLPPAAVRTASLAAMTLTLIVVSSLLSGPQQAQACHERLFPVLAGQPPAHQGGEPRSWLRRPCKSTANDLFCNFKDWSVWSVCFEGVQISVRRFYHCAHRDTMRPAWLLYCVLTRGLPR